MRQQSDFRFKIQLASTLVAISFVLLAIGLVFAAGTARAVIDNGWEAVYTTEDLCELTLSPSTATLNANGTQTFQLKIGTSEAMQAIFSENGIPPKPQAGEIDELPSEIDYGDVLDACAFGEIDRLTGLYVKFEVISGPDAGKMFETEIASDRTVTFPLTNNGALGTDQVRATVMLPEACLYAMRDVGPEDPWEWWTLSAGECQEWLTGPPEDDAVSTQRLRPVDFGALPPVTITAAANVTWIAPPVAAQATPAAVAQPAVRISSIRRCSARRVRIRPRYSAGLRSARLVVNGRTVARRSSASGFVINIARYKSRKYRFRVVATYDSGRVSSRTGTFSKCKVRVAQRRVAPRFTG